MKQVRINGRSVPAIGQGTWHIGDDAKPHDREVEALRTGIENGMTLIHTAEMYGYGKSELVVGNTIRLMNDVQKEFICKEAGLTVDELLNATEDKLGEICDMLCNIENEETIVDEELSERGKLTEGLVTLMGNAIAESNGWLDEYDFDDDYEEDDFDE